MWPLVSKPKASESLQVASVVDIYIVFRPQAKSSIEFKWLAMLLAYLINNWYLIYKMPLLLQSFSWLFVWCVIAHCICSQDWFIHRFLNCIPSCERLFYLCGLHTRFELQSILKIFCNLCLLVLMFLFLCSFPAPLKKERPPLVYFWTFE